MDFEALYNLTLVQPLNTKCTLLAKLKFSFLTCKMDVLIITTFKFLLDNGKE